MAKKSVAVPTAADYLGGSVAGWTPFHPAVADALRRHIPRKQDYPKAVTAALFLALVYRWQGRSTRFANGWFDKTRKQLCDELACSGNWLDWVVNFVCVSPADESPRGLGLVYRLTDGRDNIAKYSLNHERLTAFWLTNGVQPALSNPQLGLPDVGETGLPDVGETGLPDVGETGLPDVGEHHINIQKNLQKGNVSESASEAARQNFSPPVGFDAWLASETGQAIERGLDGEGVHDKYGMRTKVLCRYWERGQGVVDFICQRGALRAAFDASAGALRDWQGWLVKGILDNVSV